MAQLTGLGKVLSTDDPCYDPESWWFWSTDAQCSCMELTNRPIGEQCVSFGGFTQVTGGVIGGAVGSVATGVGQGIGAGIGGTLGSTELPGYLVYAAIGLVAFLMLKR